MKFRLAMTLAATLLVCSRAAAQTVIVNEGFESYADQTALKAVWVPTVGNGSAAANAADIDSGYLIGCASCAPITDPANYPGIQGQAVDHLGATASTPGMVNQYDTDNNLATDPFTLNPTGTQSIVLRADIFVGSSGNERMTVGMRSRAPANLIEMGAYNTNSCDPTVGGCNPSAATIPADMPGFYASRGYAHRIALTGTFDSPLIATPNWQYFRTEGETWGGQALGDKGFDIGLDRTTDTDTIVTIGDIGAGWHQYTTTITPDSITLTLDLFRDGLRNTSKDPVTPGGNDRPCGTPGVDAQATYPVHLGPAALNSLRIGGPSGLLSGGPGFMAFDNILLQLQEPVGPGADADFDGDGDVDGADLLTVQRGLGLTTGALATDGDADGDGDVDSDDFGAWTTQFDQTPAVGAAGAVPEPASAALVATVLCVAGAARRRRTG